MFGKKFLAVIALSVICGSLFAVPWAMRSLRRAPHTLVVVGNYSTPYLLAETMQGLTLQPYLLINNDGRCFIVMRKLIREVAHADLCRAIDDLNVRRLLIIGDENYVSKDMEIKLRKINLRNTPIIRIYGENWNRIAAELDDLLNIGNLAKEFRRNSEELSLRVRRSAPRKSDVQPKVRQTKREDVPLYEPLPEKAAPEVKAEVKAPAPAPEVKAEEKAPAPAAKAEAKAAAPAIPAAADAPKKAAK